MSRKLERAIDAGDIELVRQILAAEPGLASEPITWGPVVLTCQTEPLHYLSDAPFNQQQADLAQVLITAGAPVNGLPTSGETPFHGAATPANQGLPKHCSTTGANIEAIANYPGIPDGTPLDFAVLFGMAAVVDLLSSRCQGGISKDGCRGWASRSRAGRLRNTAR